MYLTLLLMLFGMAEYLGLSQTLVAGYNFILVFINWEPFGDG